MNIQQLKNILSDSAYANLTDAQVQALEGFGAPILTPKADRVTYTTAGAEGSLGYDKTKVLRKTLVGLAGGNTPFADDAALVHDMLTGGGFNPRDKQVGEKIGLFVANKVLTQADADALLYDASYKVGEATTEDDIKTARGLLDTERQLQARLAEADTRVSHIERAAAYAKKVVGDYRESLVLGVEVKMPDDQEIIDTFSTHMKEVVE